MGDFIEMTEVEAECRRAWWYQIGLAMLRETFPPRRLFVDLTPEQAERSYKAQEEYNRARGVNTPSPPQSPTPAASGSPS